MDELGDFWLELTCLSDTGYIAGNTVPIPNSSWYKWVPIYMHQCILVFDKSTIASGPDEDSFGLVAQGASYGFVKNV